MRHRENKLNGFSLYIIAVVLLWIKSLVIYFFEFNLRSVSIGEIVLLLLNPVGSIALFLGISLFFKNKNRIITLLSIYTIMSGVLYANILYYRFYIDFVTVPVLFQFQNVGGLSQSTLELLNWPDPFLFIDIVILVWLAVKHTDVKFSITKSRKLATMTMSLLLILFVIVGGVINNPHLFKKSYDRELLVKTLGSFNYHIYDILFNSKMSVQRVLADSTDVQDVMNYINKNKPTKSNSPLSGSGKGKNVILISLESTQQLVINRKINGEEITPFLNKLIKESLYFPNFYHQTAQGKTSDAEFMIDNGLYPLSGGSAFVRRPHNEYYALPEILKEDHYYSAVFHSNDKTFWNRENMYQSLGYDKFFSKEYYKVTEENSVNYGLKDRPFFQQSIPYLKEIPQPFYAKFLTLTNHFPFLIHSAEDQLLNYQNPNPDLVHRYFSTVRYQDEAIKDFFEQLKEEGLYDNSIIVLYGDHYGISKSYNKELEKVLGKEITPLDQVELQKVPFIIHIPGQKGQTIKTVGGEVDIRQTILDILGIEPEHNVIDFGNSLLSNTKNNIVIFRDGSFVTDKYTYTENTCYDQSTGKKTKRNKCTPYFEQVQNNLNYSDNLIFGDLLRFKDQNNGVATK